MTKLFELNGGRAKTSARCQPPGDEESEPAGRDARPYAVLSACMISHHAPPGCSALIASLPVPSPTWFSPCLDPCLRTGASHPASTLAPGRSSHPFRLTGTAPHYERTGILHPHLTPEACAPPGWIVNPTRQDNRPHAAKMTVMIRRFLRGKGARVAGCGRGWIRLLLIAPLSFPQQRESIYRTD